jgi:hypothetical protein
VMYTNQWEKARDWPNVVNFKHIKEGNKWIKSAARAYNRAHPVNKRSTQAKRHKGKGLFCFKTRQMLRIIKMNVLITKGLTRKRLNCFCFQVSLESGANLL